MIEQWRQTLYLFGFLSSFAFGSRFLVQWLTSEVKGKSVVPRSFWQLSLFGNISLAIHSLIQMQLHVLLVQVCNGVISWRNLDLLKPTPSATFKKTASLLGFALVLSLTIFFSQYLLLPDAQTLFRIPNVPWNNQQATLSFSWHLIGITGLILFNSRFWIQWWLSEKQGKSELGALFWWISLIGDLLCLTYFMQVGDPVNLVGPVFGLFPYIRNLMLIYRNPPKLTEGNSIE